MLKRALNVPVVRSVASVDISTQQKHNRFHGVERKGVQSRNNGRSWGKDDVT